MNENVMSDYVISTKFEQFELRISQLNCEDGLHFTFKIEIEANNFLVSYVFKEITYYQLPYDKKENKLDIFDEWGMRECRLKLNRDKLEFVLRDEEVLISSVSFLLNNFEDQDKLVDFIIEFNALCQSQF